MPSNRSYSNPYVSFCHRLVRYLLPRHQSHSSREEDVVVIRVAYSKRRHKLHKRDSNPGFRWQRFGTRREGAVI